LGAILGTDISSYKDFTFLKGRTIEVNLETLTLSNKHEHISLILKLENVDESLCTTVIVGLVWQVSEITGFHTPSPAPLRDNITIYSNDGHKIRVFLLVCFARLGKTRRSSFV